MIHYRIEIADAAAHQFKVTLTIADPAPEQALSLPVWIPGSYLVRQQDGDLKYIVAFCNPEVRYIPSLIQCLKYMVRQKDGR